MGRGTRVSATYSAIIGRRGSARESRKRADLRAGTGTSAGSQPSACAVFTRSARTCGRAVVPACGVARPGPPTRPPLPRPTWSHQLGTSSGLRLTCWVTLGRPFPLWASVYPSVPKRSDTWACASHGPVRGALLPPHGALARNPGMACGWPSSSGHPLCGCGGVGPTSRTAAPAQPRPCPPGPPRPVPRKRPRPVEAADWRACLGPAPPEARGRGRSKAWAQVSGPRLESPRRWRRSQEGQAQPEPWLALGQPGPRGPAEALLTTRWPGRPLPEDREEERSLGGAWAFRPPASWEGQAGPSASSIRPRWGKKRPGPGWAGPGSPPQGQWVMLGVGSYNARDSPPPILPGRL